LEIGAVAFGNQATEGAAMPSRRSRIPIVDDDQMMRDLIGRILRDEPYLLRLAADGRAALDLLETEPFDLVLTDLCMPDMDGLELIRS
jgi:CheY-like chemotaxis protein